MYSAMEEHHYPFSLIISTVPEETLRNLELMNMLSGFHYFQQPQSVMNAKQELDSYVPSPLPPPSK